MKRLKSAIKSGLIYKDSFLTPHNIQTLTQWLSTLHPLWEMRYSTQRPLPADTPQRRLLRPVYWLGNWQFACLDYFHPPKNIYNCCIEAEPFPAPIQAIAHQIEEIIRNHFHERDIPRGWHFNTCLINFYGDQINTDGSTSDCARVGEHKDFEPGPVGSLSLGERALFQFIESRHREAQSQVVFQQWLNHGSLQVFGGDRYKKRLFHRVQRVEKKRNETLPPDIDGFQTRRINFTFRYVPNEFIVPYSKLPIENQKDIREYFEELAQHSPFFRDALNGSASY